MRRLGFLFVAVFVVLLVVGFTKKGIYSNKLGINVVVVGDLDVSLVLIRPLEGMMTWVRLPQNLSVRIFKTGAVYPLSSLWKYGVSEHNAYQIVGKSLSNTLGVLLPRVVKVKGLSTPENLLGVLHKIGMQSDLSVRDRIAFRRDLVTSVSSKKYFEVDIPSAAIDIKADPDGKEFLEINSVINLWTKNKFVFDTLLGENSNVKVRNLTSVNGAGLLLSRQLESAGLRVVEVTAGSGEKFSGTGCVFRSIGGHEYTDYLLTNYSGCRNITTKEDKKSGADGVEVWIL
jgi:hypothetical protein